MGEQRKAGRALFERRQQAWELSVQGRTYAKIAQALGVSEVTVKTDLAWYRRRVAQQPAERRRQRLEHYYALAQEDFATLGDRVFEDLAVYVLRLLHNDEAR